MRGRVLRCTLAGMISTRYAVPLLWLAFVLFLGTAYFATQETGPFVLPFLKILAPGAPPAQLQAAHMVVRKLAHLTEYAVLALLWFRALLPVAGRTPREAAWIALAICLLCAFVDETHQSTIPSRHGSARDFLIDASGATGMLLVALGRRKVVDRGTPVGGSVAAEPAE